MRFLWKMPNKLSVMNFRFEIEDLSCILIYGNGVEQIGVRIFCHFFTKFFTKQANRNKTLTFLKIYGSNFFLKIHVSNATTIWFHKFRDKARGYLNFSEITSMDKTKQNENKIESSFDIIFEFQSIENQMYKYCQLKMKICFLF